MAHSIRTIIESVETYDTSVNGNPRVTLHTGDGTWRTGVDAACGYGAGNPENLAPNEVELTFNSKGAVVGIKPTGRQLPF